MKIIVFALTAVLALAAADNCICTKEYMPVCGTNGKTYSNRCLLNCAQRTEPNLRFKHDGECSTSEKLEPRQLDCPCTKEYDPVCATNGVTYANPCLFRCAKKTYESIEIAHYGECGNPRETRNLDCACPFIYLPVCGSNRVTYANECVLNCAKRRDATLYLLHYGECQ